ncbi:enoyl-CoA hydratase/isomerase family protein [Sphingomonas koreensis]|jgi:enoyl-CoA hydratase|uniref:3-hydroxyisobutyryl-CoA hydrolase n=1 Tax=Sphingomonas koreensis TaxID=93064 RepID=A0A1L6JDT5_9SPHN|nr:enoyl-CoA hydratase/isomerase family protein [Sphingomonas koreensis]APR54092.1 enoyl-CoA hydratase [Sphingomonas koreensis]MDC7809071.1 enoyl-CoA hydratase/isomerase family protein [Sphingomonas koreensis]RSU18726.1 enoyl-CoA hydratase/isomerase family protein [Sphingomonas koreensis]RSU25502.1 enoyl-CoA hydratase/isomerase family protein [Sphingomonas koreensis]RSU25762.1 enoyl-CoA hydratase/isomerase family protein [Sphingomonas koreensis]
MSDVLISVEGQVGRIRLNRPKAIHALNTGMCAAILDALISWRDDTAVEAVMIDHAEGRGFCAGGDIRMIAESGAGDGSAARDFFRVEYRMNHALFTYAKPVVAFMDGITMGGGVGISQPAKYRVATENTKLAMPETGIGLFPDVGGGWYLSRLAGRTGQYLALTGYRLDGAECLALGLASHYLHSEALEDAKARIIADPQAIDAVLDALSSPTPDARILAHRGAIDRLFASDRLEDVLAALEADGGEWAAQQLATLRTKSPQTMKVSLKLLLDGKTMPTFEDEMRQEFAVGSHVVQRHDFIEGVRALIIDKDNAPKWNPANVEEVSDHLIDQIFAPLSADQQWEP